MTPKLEFFNFGLEQKLDHHSSVEFHGEQNDDSIKVNTVNQLLLRHPSNFKRARICKPAMAFVTDI